jgi:hypoxanthine-guanine phosphoribosyltransferase
LEEGEMYSGNAEKECLIVEAIIDSGLRVSIIGATCNLPSRP